MQQVRNAVTLLLNSGKIVLPEALVELKKAKDPYLLAKLFVEKFPNKHEVARDDFLSIQSKESEISSKNTPTQLDIPVDRTHTTKKTKGSVRRRTITSTMTDTVVSAVSTQHKLAKLSQQHKRILQVKSDKLNVAKHHIRTSLDNLQGLHNYESDLKVLDNYIPIVNFGTTIDDLVNFFQDRYTRLSRIDRKSVV